MSILKTKIQKLFAALALLDVLVMRELGKTNENPFWPWHRRFRKRLTALQTLSRFTHIVE
jgi:hypothetical protein